ncbi:DUF47 domain-containing protein, partial [Nonomuraea rubra]
MDTTLTEALTGQLRATKDGARLAMAMVAGEIDNAGAHERMRTIEHLGDTQRARLVVELESVLITPIHREDLLRLSSAIDDVLDALRDFVRATHLYRLPRQTCFTPLLDQVIAGIDALDEAVRHLTSKPSAAVGDALAAKQAGGAVRRRYQYEIARIFAGELTADKMKERELARLLEIAGTCPIRRPRTRSTTWPTASTTPWPACRPRWSSNGPSP